MYKVIIFSCESQIYAPLDIHMLMQRHVYTPTHSSTADMSVSLSVPTELSYLEQ